MPNERSPHFQVTMTPLICDKLFVLLARMETRTNLKGKIPSVPWDHPLNHMRKILLIRINSHA